MVKEQYVIYDTLQVSLITSNIQTLKQTENEPFGCIISYVTVHGHSTTKLRNAIIVRILGMLTLCFLFSRYGSRFLLVNKTILNNPLIQQPDKQG